MQDPNLPPGCTALDIDRAMGAVRRCSECRREFYPTDEQLESDEPLECQKCHGRDPDREYEDMKERRAMREEFGS
jgi:DNA-directed RNA polymerase subunit RPC12/RpoP